MYSIILMPSRVLLTSARLFVSSATPMCRCAFVRDDRADATPRTIRIEPAKKYFVNAGSVGQPRDGNWRAAYCIYDVENNLVELLRIKYDLATAQKKITKAGLPRLLSNVWQWDAEEKQMRSAERVTPCATRYKVTVKNRTQRLPALPSILRSLAENKICNRQIVRVSDFEIKIVVENERDLPVEPFDC